MNKQMNDFTPLLSTSLQLLFRRLVYALHCASMCYLFSCSWKSMAVVPNGKMINFLYIFESVTNYADKHFRPHRSGYASNNL